MNMNSLAHTTREGKYYMVFAPKYRRQIIYKKLRADIEKDPKRTTRGKRDRNYDSGTPIN